MIFTILSELDLDKSAKIERSGEFFTLVTTMLHKFDKDFSLAGFQNKDIFYLRQKPSQAGWMQSQFPKSTCMVESKIMVTQQEIRVLGLDP